MIDVDDNLFELDIKCIVPRFVYKANKNIMSANIFYITGFNAWDMTGVYLLFYKHELVYIGKSDRSIGDRIKAHDNDDRFNFDGFAIIECENPIELEMTLIKEAQPKYNLIGKFKKYK